MQNFTNSLTAVVEHDWCSRNLIALQSSLRETTAAVNARTNVEADPLMDSPNRPNIRGQLRWVILPRIMENHIKAGRYPGITSRWISLGGVNVFELVGESTSITVCHLRHADDVPKESTFRKEKRRSNAVAQMRLALEESNENKVNLTLVHGEEDEGFAFLRAYFNEDNRSYYHRVSANIMNLPVLLDDVETEQVPDPQVELGLKLNPARFYKA